MLGKRSAVLEPEQEEVIRKAVDREIKRQRNCTVPDDSPVTLQELRAKSK